MFIILRVIENITCMKILLAYKKILLIEGKLDWNISSCDNREIIVYFESIDILDFVLVYVFIFLICKFKSS